MGRQGILQLLAAIDDPATAVRQTRIPVSLVLRDSVATPAHAEGGNALVKSMEVRSGAGRWWSPG
jgi:hypothetical protein